MRFSSHPFAALLFLIQHVSIGSTFTCDPKPDYQDGRISRLIRFSNAHSNPGLTWDFSLGFSVSTSLSAGEHELNASMDTGSTAVAISASLMDLKLEDVQNYPKGAESLSGGTLWEGHWIPASEVNLTFAAVGVIAKVPVFAVTERSTCHDFKNGECGDKTDVVEMPDTVKYVGVGFGRWTAANPDSTPDKNPLLNIAFIDGSPTPEDQFYTGYTITTAGVEVGLTSGNVQNFLTTKLDLLPSPGVPQNWASIDASIAVDDSDWNTGTALFDSGIHQSYIRFNAATTAMLHTTTIVDSNITRTVLTDDSTVRMRVGKGPDYIANYTVRVGDETNVIRPYLGEFRPQQPSMDDSAYLNTGRFFYNGFEAMFDAKCGWFGLRPNE